MKMLQPMPQLSRFCGLGDRFVRQFFFPRRLDLRLIAGERDPVQTGLHPSPADREVHGAIVGVNDENRSTATVCR